VFRQIRIGFSLSHNAFEVVLAGEPEQCFAISVDVIAVQEAFAALRHHSMKPELAVDQRQIPEVFAVSESALLLFIIREGVLVPEDVEGVKERLGTSDREPILHRDAENS
jgi:hypothetical protein